MGVGAGGGYLPPTRRAETGAIEMLYDTRNSACEMQFDHLILGLAYSQQ